MRSETGRKDEQAAEGYFHDREGDALDETLGIEWVDTLPPPAGERQKGMWHRVFERVYQSDRRGWALIASETTKRLAIQKASYLRSQVRKLCFDLVIERRGLQVYARRFETEYPSEVES